MNKPSSCRVTLVPVSSATPPRTTSPAASVINPKPVTGTISPATFSFTLTTGRMEATNVPFIEYEKATVLFTPEELKLVQP